MSIWFASPSIEDANRRMQPVLGGHLGILFTEFGADYLRGTMPVEPRTHQPMGILHGGASARNTASRQPRRGGVSSINEVFDVHLVRQPVDR